MPTNPYRIRTNLKRTIRAKGLTMAATARLAGLAYSRLDCVVNGRAAPTLAVMLALADALHTEPNDLFPGEYRAAIEAAADSTGAA